MSADMQAWDLKGRFTETDDEWGDHHDDFDPDDDWIGYAESAGICPWCGETMLDDMEVGQGYCAVAPCWMWATGQIELAMAWEHAQREIAPQYAPLPQNRGRRLLWPPMDERGYVV